MVGAASLQRIDYLTFLPEVSLRKVDRAAMAHGVEVRVPFLDHELVEWACSKRPRYALEREPYKRVLRSRLADCMPPTWLDRPKRGFGTPVKRMLTRKDYLDSLMGGVLIERGWFSRSKLEQLIDSKDDKALWPCFVLERWGRKWMDEL